MSADGLQTILKEMHWKTSSSKTTKQNKRQIRITFAINGIIKVNLPWHLNYGIWEENSKGWNFPSSFPPRLRNQISEGYLYCQIGSYMIEEALSDMLTK